MRTTIRVILCLLVTATLSIGAAASCRSNDSWRGQDKNQHFVLGGVTGLATTLGTGSRLKGWAAGTAVGALKELSDSSGRGDCSLQDFLVTSLGAGVGALTGGVLLTYADGKTTVWIARSW